MNESIFALINAFNSIGTKLRAQISFTGLSDGPQSYNSNQYLKSSDNGIEYISLSGLGEELYTGKHFFRNFSELQDTPSGYQGHSGDYLVVNDNESGIHFTGIEKIAADLTDYGFGGVGGSLTIPSYTDLPDVTENDGKIVASGCDLYHSCDGAWIKIIKENTITRLSEGESDGLPGCVATVEDKVNYLNYRDEVIIENASDTFSLSLQGLVSPTLHEACLYAEFQGLPDDSVNLKFAESNYKWAIAPDSLLHPQIDYDSPAVSQIFTVNNPGPYNSSNQESMPLLDESPGGYTSQITDMHFSEDGLRAVGFGFQSRYVHEYLFTKPYDLSTGTRSKFKSIIASNHYSSTDDYYSGLIGRNGVVKTDDPSVVYVHYIHGIERKILDTPGDLYSITVDNDWYVKNEGQDSYFGHYGKQLNRGARYWIVSMDFANNGNTLILFFVKNPHDNNDPNDKRSVLVSYNLTTPYLLPGNMPSPPSIWPQFPDEVLPAPSMEVALDNITADNDSFPYQGSKIFGSGRYVFVRKVTKLVILEMGVPGDLNTIFVKGEVQANPSAGIDDNILPHWGTSVFPKDNLDLFMFSAGSGGTLISTTLSDPWGSLEGSPCQFLEWKTSNQNLIINSNNPSNSEITFNQNLSITGVFNCN